MKNLILVAILITLGCSSIKENVYKFQPTTCNPDEMPEFDGNKVTILDDNGTPLKDTILGGIEKEELFLNLVEN